MKRDSSGGFRPFTIHHSLFTHLEIGDYR